METATCQKCDKNTREVKQTRIKVAQNVFLSTFLTTYNFPKCKNQASETPAASANQNGCVV